MIECPECNREVIRLIWVPGDGPNEPPKPVCINCAAHRGQNVRLS